MTSYAPPGLARALAAVTWGDDGWVPDGVHWHADLSPALGLPLHPFLVWASQAPEPTEPPVRWTDGSGHEVSVPFHLGSTGPVTVELLPLGRPPALWVWARVQVRDGPARIEVLDQRVSPAGADRVLVSCSAEPYALGAPGITRLRVSGDAWVDGVTALDAERMDFGSPETVQNVGLPVDDLWWYIHGTRASADDWLDRVGGSLRRLPPMDNLPTGQAPLPVDLQAELRRVEVVRSDPERWLHELLPDETAGGPGVWSQLTTPARPGHLDPRRVSYRPLDALLSAATADPGLARWLGITARLRDPQPAPQPGPYLVFAAATWAVPTSRVAFQGLPGPRDDVTLGALLAGTSTPGVLIERVRAELSDDWRHVEEVLDRLRDASEDLRWELSTLLLVAAAEGERAVDLPPAPDAQVLSPGAWLPAVLGGDGRLVPREVWRQEVSLVGGSPNGPVALVREEPDGPVSVHQQVDVDGEPPRRSLAMLAGYPDATSGRPDLAGAGLGGPASRRATNSGAAFVGHALPAALTTRDPVIVDGSVPATGAGAAWSVSEGDWLGRWGPSGPVSASLPDRPRPGTPAISGLLVRGPLPAGAAAASAGVLRVSVGVPAVIAPGGRPVTAVRLSVDDGASWLDLPAPVAGDGLPTVVNDLPAPPTEPGGGVDVSIIAVIDDNDLESERARCVVEVHDARPAPPPNTSRRLVVAGRRDTEGRSEVALRWSATPGAAGYRVYLGAQERLLRVLGLPPTLAGGPRAALADAICERESALVDRGVFTLLTPQPLPVPADGGMHYTAALPGGLTGVTFLRVVPVTKAGVEAPFATCSLTPVVVPVRDTPPAPGLSATVQPDGRVWLRIDVRGIDARVIARLGGGTPRVRLLRRHPSLPDDPAYWPEVAVTDLAPGPTSGWTADVTVGPADGFPPWTSLEWAAQAAYPTEPTLPAGATPEPADLRAEWPGPEATPSPWGPASPPAYAMVTPDLPAPTVTLVDAADGTVTMRIGGIPNSPAGATAPIRLRVLVGGNGGLAPFGDPVEVAGTDTVVPGLPSVERYAVQAVDPLGRLGTPVLAEH